MEDVVYHDTDEAAEAGGVRGWGGGGSGLWRSGIGPAGVGMARWWHRPLARRDRGGRGGGIVAAGAGGLPGRCPRPRGPGGAGGPHHCDAPPLVAAGPAAGWSIPVAPARAPRVGRSCFYRGGPEGPDTPGSSLLPQWEDHRMAEARRRVALVTGSSRGLGAVIARRLALDGLAVAVNGRPGEEQVMAVSRGIRDDGGVAEGFHADVTDEGQVAGLAAAISDR